MRNTEQNSELYVQIPSNGIPNLAKLDAQIKDTKREKQRNRYLTNLVLTIIGTIASIIAAITGIISSMR